MAQDFKNLTVWQKSVELSVCIYRLTRSFPKEEIYGLTAQMRRASISIASNIAEGRGRINPAEFRQFLGMAQGSVCELKTQLIIAAKLGFGEANELNQAGAIAEEISKMLVSLISKLKLPQKL